MSEGDRQYIVETTKAYYRLTLAAGLRLTFGPLMPYNKGDYTSNGRSGVALRIYKGKDECLSLIQDVVSFRETTSFGWEKLCLDETSEEVWVNDADGRSDRKKERIDQVYKAMTKTEEELGF